MKNIQEEIEDKIIDCINSGVSGRLVIFKPEEKGLEGYLAVERKGEYKEKEIYFKIKSIVGHGQNVNFIKELPQESLKSGNNFYLLFIYFDEVMQKISDYVWLVPSAQFRDIAEVIKSASNKKLLKFEAPLDIKTKNKYSKFLVSTKELGGTILSALEKGGKFDFEKGNISEEEKAVNLEDLKEFLRQARENTHAADASLIDNPRLQLSKQLEFQRGNYFYRDIYFSGSKKIIGQEIVYQDSKPVWGMNYIGSITGKLEANFLKEALLNLSGKSRLGGICEYRKREFRYQDQGRGNLEEFYGREEIFLEGKNIYKLNYQGGLISDKL